MHRTALLINVTGGLNFHQWGMLNTTISGRKAGQICTNFSPLAAPELLRKKAVIRFALVKAVVLERT